MENVWSDSLANRTKFVIAGLGSREVYENFCGKYDMKNIESLGKQDDLKDLIRRARLAVVPLINGSGTRLKCLEGMALRTQVLSTGRGAEGIEHKGSILIADKPDEFRDCILDRIGWKRGPH